MKLFFRVLLAACLAAPTWAYAQTAGRLVVSTVDSIYVREHNGLFMETRLVPRSRLNGGKPELWALVRYTTPGENRSSSELTQIPADVDLRKGDVVEVFLGEGGASLQSGPVRVAARVARVVSRVEPAVHLAAEAGRAVQGALTPIANVAPQQ